MIDLVVDDMNGDFPSGTIQSAFACDMRPFKTVPINEAAVAYYFETRKR